MKSFWLTINLLLLIFIFGCQKEESSKLSGTIEGKVYLIDQHFEQSSNNSGVAVIIKQDTFQRQVYTDEYGIFSFPHVPYGIYSISYQKDGFLVTDNDLYSIKDIKHVGGFADTRKELYLYQVPTFEIILDSIVKETDPIVSEYNLRFYAKTSVPCQSSGYYAFRCFISDSPLVSKDLSSLILPGYKLLVNGNILTGRISDSYSQLKNLNVSKIYIKIYPEAFGHYYISNIALGIPSNTLSFNLY